jgi:hypothetical protein
MRLGPRAQGVREHVDRAKWFLQLARATSEPVGRFRLLIAATYSARALVEVMLEAAERQELTAYCNVTPKQARDDFESEIERVLPHFHLIERIRIHDFHRFGCLPPDPQVKTAFTGGTIKVGGGKGSAEIRLTAEGPRVTTSGQARVEQQRPLHQVGENFFDDSGRWVGLECVLDDYLACAPQAIDMFERALGLPSPQRRDDG